MGYDVKNDPYIDTATGIFRNKLNITSQKSLDEAEFFVTSTEIALLSEQPIYGNFDLEHVIAIHNQLFNQLYDWAGVIRTITIGKGETLFTHPDHIHSYANQIFLELKEENYLHNLDEESFIERFAHYYSELNLIHPFREGNGRTQRAFFTLLARYNGWIVNWDQMYQDDNINASIAAYNGDEDPLVEILHPLLEWVHEDYWYFKSRGDGTFAVDKSIKHPIH